LPEHADDNPELAVLDLTVDSVTHFSQYRPLRAASFAPDSRRIAIQVGDDEGLSWTTVITIAVLALAACCWLVFRWIRRTRRRHLEYLRRLKEVGFDV
jgi:hypothetical protein